MLVHHVRVQPEDVVFVKGVLEASEGLAAMFADKGGNLSIAAPYEQRADLAELLADLADELGAMVVGDATPGLVAQDVSPAGTALVDG